MDRNRIAVREPKHNRCFKLRNGHRFFGDKNCGERFRLFGRTLLARRWSAHAVILSSLFLMVFAEPASAVRLPRALVPIYRTLGNSSLGLFPLLGIHNVPPYTSRKNNQVPSCESKDLSRRRICQNALQFPFHVLSLSVLAASGKETAPTLPIGLPTAILASLLTAAICWTSLAASRREMGLTDHGISLSQRTVIALQSLLLGLLSGCLLGVLEVSLRALLK